MRIYIIGKCARKRNIGIPHRRDNRFGEGRRVNQHRTGTRLAIRAIS